jgi:hypothetical protein
MMKRILLLWLPLLSAGTQAQEHKNFHVTDVKQYQLKCTPPSETGTTCGGERWRVTGYTDTTDYELVCSEVKTYKDGKTTSIECLPMSVGEDIKVQIFPSMIAYPPLREGQDRPDYSWYVIQHAKERERRRR